MPRAHMWPPGGGDSRAGRRSFPRSAALAGRPAQSALSSAARIGAGSTDSGAFDHCDFSSR
jgi:hypothetical protein